MISHRCRWDFFHRPESNRVDPRTLDCKVFSYYLPADMPVDEAISHAYANGLPKGSARCGLVEIQNDQGIYSRPKRTANFTFTAWEN